LLLLYTLVGNVFDEPYAYTPPLASAVSGPFTTADARPCGVYAGYPVLVKNDATYVVPAVTATGEEKFSSCHPDAVSLENVPLASTVPEELHKVPVCVPVSLLSL
jgi:hypothetical protein